MERNIRVLWATAKVIEDARNALGLSQTQLADFAGFARSFISVVECGNTGISIDTLLQVAGVLRVDASELMRRIEEELKRGPKPPEKTIGRPLKTAEKEKRSNPATPGSAGAKKQPNRKHPRPLKA